MLIDCGQPFFAFFSFDTFTHVSFFFHEMRLRIRKHFDMSFLDRCSVISLPNYYKNIRNIQTNKTRATEREKSHKIAFPEIKINFPPFDPAMCCQRMRSSFVLCSIFLMAERL